MKVLFGTTNKAKVKHMQEMLYGMNIEIVGLDEMGQEIPEVVEDGMTPLENARIKALAYYEMFNMPVFACDSGMYLKGMDDHEQPGVTVRRPDGWEMNDEEMIAYYAGIARDNGGEVMAWYENAICLVIDEKSVHGHQGEDIASVKFIISETPCAERRKGYPIDSLSKEIESGDYYLELGRFRDDKHMPEGFRQFFRRYYDI